MQNHHVTDQTIAICVLPNNIVHQKFFLFLWFWFLALVSLTMGLLVYRVALYTVPGLRTLITMTFWAGQKNSQMLKPFTICKQYFSNPPVYCVLLSPFTVKWK